MFELSPFNIITKQITIIGYFLETNLSCLTRVQGIFFQRFT